MSVFGVVGALHVRIGHPLHPHVGTIRKNNAVRVKASPDAPELPMANAEVRLHRLSDGHVDWRGRSQIDGSYVPVGLALGRAYVPVAIDRSGKYECVASGPVIAELPDA